MEMRNGLQEMRRAAGYSNAQEFADAIEVSLATYRRYEQDPAKIPLPKAWLIADRLGCTIDAVVGRVAPDPGAGRGEMQRAYDALSERARRGVDEFIEFQASKDAAARRRRADDEARRWERAARNLERRFFLERGDEDEVLFGTPEELRAQFEAYIEQEAERRAAMKADDECVERESQMLQTANLLVVDDDGARPTGLQDPETVRLIRSEIERLRADLEDEYRRENAERNAEVMEAFDRIHEDDYGKEVEYGVVRF